MEREKQEKEKKAVINLAGRKVNGNRKVMVAVMLERDEIRWLDNQRARDPRRWGSSRSAIIRYAVRYFMENGLPK